MLKSFKPKLTFHRNQIVFVDAVQFASVDATIVRSSLLNSKHITIHLNVIGELFGRLIADHSIPFDRLAFASIRELTLQNQRSAQFDHVFERSVRVGRITADLVTHVGAVIFLVTAQAVRQTRAVATAKLLGRALLTWIVHLQVDVVTIAH